MLYGKACNDTALVRAIAWSIPFLGKSREKKCTPLSFAVSRFSPMTFIIAEIDIIAKFVTCSVENVPVNCKFIKSWKWKIQTLCKYIDEWRQTPSNEVDKSRHPFSSGYGISSATSLWYFLSVCTQVQSAQFIINQNWISDYVGPTTVLIRPLWSEINLRQICADH